MSLFSEINLKFRPFRKYILLLMAVSVILWYYFTDKTGGLETIMRIQWISWLLVLVAPTYWVRKTLLPGNSQDLLKEAVINKSLPAAIIWLGMAILSGMLFMAFASMARASEPPAQSIQYLSVLKSETQTYWPDFTSYSILAGQVEQETCVSLKSKKCWNPKTELKTDREYGFGLGQLTQTKKFDNFLVAKGLDPSLKDWKFEERYNANKQLRTLVLMDKQNSNRLDFVTDSMERIAMSLAAYNGGMGGVLSDRRLCSSIPGCEPNIWFGNVELYSLKNKVKTAGYGKSFFEINREYPRNILHIRSPRYKAWFKES